MLLKNGLVLAQINHLNANALHNVYMYTCIAHDAVDRVMNCDSHAGSV